MRLFVILLVSVVFASSSEGESFLRFKHITRVHSAALEIDTDGSTQVVVRRRSGEIQSHGLKLDHSDLRYIESLCDSVPNTSRGEWSEDGMAVTRWSDGAEKTFVISRAQSPSLFDFIDRVTTQAIVMAALLEQQDVYSVEVAIDPRQSGPKVFQPRGFRGPLVDFLRHSEDRTKIARALNALQFITTPEEFARVVHDHLFPETGGFRADRTYGIPTGNLEKAAHSALMPVFHAAAVHLTAKRGRAQQEDDALTGFLESMARLRYAPAIPLFRSLEGEFATLTPGPRMCLIAQFGAAGLPYIRELLLSKSPAVRMNACKLVLIASRSNPNGRFAHPVGAGEYVRMRRYIAIAIYPVIRKMAAEAPGEVRKRIEDVMDEIWLEMSQHPNQRGN